MFARSTTRLLTLGSRSIRSFASKSSVDYSKYSIRTRNICFGFNIVRKGEIGFIERFGKLNRSADPGLNLTIPLIESYSSRSRSIY